MIEGRSRRRREEQERCVRSLVSLVSSSTDRSVCQRGQPRDARKNWLAALTFDRSFAVAANFLIVVVLPVVLVLVVVIVEFIVYYSSTGVPPVSALRTRAHTRITRISYPEEKRSRDRAAINRASYKHFIFTSRLKWRSCARHRCAFNPPPARLIAKNRLFFPGACFLSSFLSLLLVSFSIYIGLMDGSLTTRGDARARALPKPGVSGR